MAILEPKTKHYYKIDFANCSIRGLKVYVAFQVYASEADRKKEIERLEDIDNFLQNLRFDLHNKNTKFLRIIDERKLKLDNILDNEGKISKTVHSDLRLIQDKMNQLENFESSFFNKTHLFGENTKIESIKNTLFVNDDLKKLGFKQEWITDPVRIVSEEVVYAGEYNGEDLTHEFFYNRLKKVMNNLGENSSKGSLLEREE